ncbi:hypothetical protein [Streptococcus sp. DD13]|uniref:hypothetical protein n=1 Tax=Streptococcus sp. DD13 TaxID=1777881 RepID=UPI0007991DBC|nr:hypothetical protein [Streptococcus sp. DD13]KXT78242.1 hypothetical protein STRDD13_00875 [Streptococcus sp. DD13]
MNQNELNERLLLMRKQYMDNRENQTVSCQPSKQMKKIKKRIVELETERCHRIVDHEDVSVVDQKIVEQKRLFQELATKK